MTHPITPPPELVEQWVKEANTFRYLVNQVHQYIATRAAQYGADQELEACCELMDRDFMAGPSDLRAARRPKPPSLKEQALEALGPDPLPETGPTGDTILNMSSIERHRTIRRALEALPE
jgi:hypothetical protein